MTDGAGNYGINEACAFTLTGPATLTREEFGIEGGFYACNRDWLQVDGIKYCDDFNPFPLTLDLTAATAFDFKTSGRNNRAGFRICISSCPAVWFFVPGQGCEECGTGQYADAAG
jgi:hypothetical protein